MLYYCLLLEVQYLCNCNYFRNSSKTDKSSGCAIFGSFWPVYKTRRQCKLASYFTDEVQHGK